MAIGNGDKLAKLTKPIFVWLAYTKYQIKTKERIAGW